MYKLLSLNLVSLFLLLCSLQAAWLEDDKENPQRQYPLLASCQPPFLYKGMKLKEGHLVRRKENQVIKKCLVTERDQFVTFLPSHLSSINHISIDSSGGLVISGCMVPLERKFGNQLTDNTQLNLTKKNLENDWLQYNLTVNNIELSKISKNPINLYFFVNHKEHSLKAYGEESEQSGTHKISVRNFR